MTDRPAGAPPRSAAVLGIALRVRLAWRGLAQDAAEELLAAAGVAAAEFIGGLTAAFAASGFDVFALESPDPFKAHQL